jgi:single-strand DNA-binding protein
MTYQKIVIIGNLGGDPLLRFMPSGVPVTSFSVACNSKYTDQDGQKKAEVNWYQVNCFGKLAESTSQFLKKGRKVLVEGRPIADQATGSPRIWTRQDGTPAASFEIRASNVQFLDHPWIMPSPEFAPLPEEAVHV